MAIIYFSFIWLITGSSLYSPTIYTQDNEITDTIRRCVVSKDGYEPIGIGRTYYNLIPITHRTILNEENGTVFVRNHFYIFPLNTVEIDC